MVGKRLDGFDWQPNLKNGWEKIRWFWLTAKPKKMVGKRLNGFNWQPNLRNGKEKIRWFLIDSQP